jgi:HlyD family secretion protein
MDENKKFLTNNMLLALTVVLAVIGLIALAGFFLLTPPDDYVMGQAEATQVRISGKVPGRIAAYYFEEGDNVKKGDSLVFIDAPEIEAKLMQAEAARTAAEAQSDKAIAGARSQEVIGAYETWLKAKAGLEIAQKSFQRVQNLYDKGVMSAQKRDETEANCKVMEATEKAAKSQYDMAKAGSRMEDKKAVAALANQASGVVVEVKTYMEESILRSPVDGEISERFPQLGELVGAGAPIMNITNMDDMWVTFNVREDLLNRMKIGSEIKAFIPALNNRAIVLKVYYMKDMGVYAVWKATKTTGQYDAKTFEVRARPMEKITDLRPGMSVVIRKKDNGIL